MKTDENTHNLGSQFRQGRTYWYYLTVPVDAPWYVTWEIDYDNPNHESQYQILSREQISNHALDDESLANAIAKKLTDLGKIPS